MLNFSGILENEIALLRPVKESDYSLFLGIAFDNDIWKGTTFRIGNEDELKNFIHEAVEARKADARFPFTIIDKKSGKAAGSTSYGNISEKDKRLEIGMTWLGIDFQGTGLNKACKFLLIKNAFENLDLERVEFKTDVLNIQARRALIKVGAVEEGILRSHTVMPDGRRRDTIYYSILKREWNKLKETVFNEFT